MADYFDTVKNYGEYNGQTFTDHNKYLQAKGVQGASGGTTPGASSSGWFPSFSDLGQSTTDFNKGLNQSENDILSKYTAAAGNQQKPIDIYKQLQASGQIPQMRETAADMRGQLNNLEDTIRRVEGNVNATTRDSLVTEGQRQNMITAQKQPLLNTYEPLATAYGRVQEGISSAEEGSRYLTNLAVQGNQQELVPYEKALELQISQNARAMTGFTEDKQTQLQLLLEKLHRQQALDDREWQQAAQLSLLDKQYQQEVNKIKLQQQSGSTSNKTQIVEQGGRRFLVDMTTGKVIADYGSGGATNTNNGW